MFLLQGCRTVFGLAQGLLDSKTNDLNCSYEALRPERSIDNMSRQGIGIIFMCSIILGRFIRLCYDTGSLRITLLYGGKVGSPICVGLKPLPSSSPTTRSQYICYKYIIEEWGKIHNLIAFYKLFLSDIKVKILIKSWHFLMIFLDVPFL